MSEKKDTPKAEVNVDIQIMIDEAVKAALKTQAENKSAATKSASVGMTKEQETYLNELVQVKLFKDNGKYKDDVVIPVNGKNWQIKRGKLVMIPRYVLMAYENSQSQSENASDIMLGYQEEFEKNADKLT